MKIFFLLGTGIYLCHSNISICHILRCYLHRFLVHLHLPCYLHHVQCQVTDGLGMVSAGFWKSAHRHVLITDRLHLPSEQVNII